MNEKFNQLLQAATAEVDSTISEDEWRTYIHDNAIQAKFAEMIIRECIEVCKSRVGNSDYNTGRMHCVSDLKEHFGLEE